MSDIVERLTDLAIDVEQTDFDCQSQMLNEAAAEIERLRDENRRLAKSRDKWGQRYNQTLEKLRHAVMSDSEYCKAIDNDNERLRAQVSALREALNKIDAAPVSYSAETLRKMARAALEGK